jgi:hypothetical protein
MMSERCISCATWLCARVTVLELRNAFADDG